MASTDSSALLDQVRSEVCRRRKELDLLAQKPTANGRNTKNSSSEAAVTRLDLLPSPAVPARIRLRDLLQYDDRQFVEYAYRCILNRPMDSGGEWHVERLRKGKSKIDVLLQIRYGREGKDRGVRIRGMRMLRVLSRAKRLPVLGFLVRGAAYVFQLTWCVARLPLERRAQEGWNHRAMSLFAKTEDHINNGQTHIAKAFDRLDSESRGTTHKELAQLGEQVCRLESANEEMREKRRQERDLNATKDDLAILTEQLSRIENGKDELGRRFAQIGEQVCRLESANEEMREKRRQESDLNATKDDLAVLTDRLSRIENGKEELERHSERLAQIGRMKVELDVLSRRLDGIASIPSGYDELYASLEDQFRGPMEEIRNRQEFYVPFVQAAEAGTPDAPILDLGCGRGEWLGILNERGLAAYGVESNTVFFSRCRQEELTVKQEDLLHHLESLACESLGAITGFHIIEHLPADQQIRLVQLAYRALRPGGVLILETPNPEHLSVAALRFYLDPTHVRPVPAVLLQFFAEHSGFREVRIERLSPSQDGEASKGWSQYQDYGMIAVRPNGE